MALYGLDLSHYQATDTVDQAQDFVILKATEGFTDASGPGYIDPDCDNKYQRAKSQGKLLGVYGYAIMLDAVQEATFFVQNIQGYIGEALLVFDNETHTNVGFALTWLDTVYGMTQVRPLIYMSASTARAVDWSPVLNAGYALYVAGYPSQFNVPNPGVPAPDGSDMPYATGAWPYATIWQYTSSAGTLDRDIAYMTREAWNKFAIGDRNVPVPEPTTTTTTITTTSAPDPVTTTTTTEAVQPDPTTTTTTTTRVVEPPSTTTTTTIKLEDQPTVWSDLWVCIVWFINWLRNGRK